MKALILILTFAFTFAAQAQTITLNQLESDQKAKLIEVLNQLDQEALDALLTDEAYDWYVEQFNREFEMAADVDTKKIHGRIELDGNPYENPNAPQF